MFGGVDGAFDEWGFFTLSQLDIKKRGLPLIERDAYWDDKYTFVGTKELFDTYEKAKQAYDREN